MKHHFSGTKLFALTLLFIALALGALQMRKQFVRPNLLAGKVQCPNVFVLEKKADAPAADLLLSKNPPVYEDGQECVGLCVEQSELKKLRARYIIED